VRLSYTFLKFAEHLERGRVPPGQVDAHWFGDPARRRTWQGAQGRARSGQAGARAWSGSSRSTRSTPRSRRCWRAIARSRPRGLGAAARG
jgi:hypothetical protein